MTSWLTDDVVGHLRQVASWPDVSGTRYEVIEEIGRGGMGTVYRALDTQLGRDVALKVICTDGDHAAIAARLALEARVLARLDHPGVVPIHECGVLADGRAFYAMKLVHGEVLDDYLARTAADEARIDRRLRLFERIAEPVAFAHAHGIVHRDLNPRNVMIGPFGEVLVMDWGAARLQPSDGLRGVAIARALEFQSPEEAGTVIGTPGYMSPEQALGTSADADPRSDVYALGALLRQMLSGQPPQGPQPSDPPAAASAPLRVPGVSKRLRAICAKALAARPADRYADAGALAADIARYRAGEPVDACPETWLDRAARFYTTYRTAILLVVAYLTMRALFALFWRSQ